MPESSPLHRFLRSKNDMNSQTVSKPEDKVAEKKPSQADSNKKKLVKNSTKTKSCAPVKVIAPTEMLSDELKRSKTPEKQETKPVEEPKSVNSFLKLEQRLQLTSPKIAAADNVGGDTYKRPCATKESESALPTKSPKKDEVGSTTSRQLPARKTLDFGSDDNVKKETDLASLSAGAASHVTESDSSAKVEKQSSTSTVSPKESETAVVNETALKPSPAQGKKKTKTRKKKQIAELKPEEQITHYFPVRRSGRKPQVEQQREKEKAIVDGILREAEEGLEVVETAGKGRGVIAARLFQRGEFVVEYRGDLISPAEANKRELSYQNDSQAGCYMYHFVHKNRRYCVDATAESPYIGRLVNHSAKKPNLMTKAFDVHGQPHLVLLAAKTIERGEELLYDYGDRDKDAVACNPWLKNS